MSRVKFPEGLKIQDKKGPGKLSETLDKLKKYSFQGYIKIKVNEELEGYITLKEGSPKNALLYTPSDMEIKGEEALEKIMNLDDRDDLYLEVHTKVDIDKLVKNVGGKLGEKKRDTDDEIREEVKDLLDRVGRNTKSIQEEISEEVEEREKSKESEEVDSSIHKKELEEKELEVYDMVIKERRGEEMNGSTFPEKFSFDNFVVGENNKFGFVSAREVARATGRTFNPLFLTSDAGLGKTHLLKAIGNYLMHNRSELNVKYASTEKCTSELITSLREDIDSLRKSYYDTDILLLDDVQFLAGREKHQEIIFHLFNHLKNKSSQIIITSDRPPEQIPTLKDRLVSRFKSGLVVKIEPPSYETRLKIIEKKIAQHDIEVPDEVMEFLATHITENVREIEGAINRLLAFSSLLNEPITLERVRENFKQHVKSKEEETAEDITKKLEPGLSYVIEEERPEKGFKILEHLAKRNKDVYILSRINPNRIKKDYSLDKAEIYWLTGKESDELETVPPNLESITWTLEEIVQEGKVILLDGLEYLISQTGFDATIQFVRHIVDTISETETTFLITVSPSALKKRQISILEREMKVISTV